MVYGEFDNITFSPNSKNMNITDELFIFLSHFSRQEFSLSGEMCRRNLP